MNTKNEKSRIFPYTSTKEEIHRPIRNNESEGQSKLRVRTTGIESLDRVIRQLDDAIEKLNRTVAGLGNPKDTSA